MNKCCKPPVGGCGVYGLGVIGAAVYFLQHAASFQDWIVGLFKAVFWPAFFVYKALTMTQI